MSLLPSLGQPNDISSQTVLNLTEISPSDHEYFTPSCTNSLIYQIWGLKEKHAKIEGGVEVVGTEEEQKVHFLDPKTQNVLISSPLV